MGPDSVADVVAGACHAMTWAIQVIIQMETRKVISDMREKIRKDLDSLPDYFSARAGEW